MQVAIISDIHDHISNLHKALESARHCDVMLCCGDLCSPFIIRQLGQGFSNDIHIVFGNNDADLFRITNVAAKYSNIYLHGELGEIELDSQLFAINHFDNISRVLAMSDKYDVVCFGHNHQFEISTVNKTILINPGEIMGELTGQAGFVIYHTDTKQPTRIAL